MPATARPKKVIRHYNKKTPKMRKELLDKYPVGCRFSSRDLVKEGMQTSTGSANLFLSNTQIAQCIDREPIRLRREGDHWVFVKNDTVVAPPPQEPDSK